MSALKDGTITIKNSANGVIISFSSDFKTTNDAGDIVPVRSPWTFEVGHELQASAKLIEIANLTLV